MSNDKKTDATENFDEEIEIEEEEVIQLVDDEGNVVDFYWVGTIEYKGDMYVAFEPANEHSDEEEETEVAIFKLDEDEEGNDVFSPLEDEKLLNTVFEEFLKLQENQDCCGNSDGGCGNDGECEHGCDCNCKKS